MKNRLLLLLLVVIAGSIGQDTSCMLARFKSVMHPNMILSSPFIKHGFNPGIQKPSLFKAVLRNPFLTTRIVFAKLFGRNAFNQQFDHTPIYWAIHNNDMSRLKALIALGANPSEPNADGITPLYAAVIRGNLKAVKILINAGVNVEAPVFGDTPLHTAVEMFRGKSSKWRDSVEIVKIILIAGASRGTANRQGETTAMIALRKYAQAQNAQGNKDELDARTEVVRLICGSVLNKHIL